VEVVLTPKLPDSATLGVAGRRVRAKERNHSANDMCSASPYYYNSRIEILMRYALLRPAIRSKRG